ncbi:glycosyltransferase [Micromonospora parastrephiae]|uniref:glycosyltransferase n=1 Tax=Micromonospora parastrephiae TaxID=2806101 RepID=UPI001EE3DB01|nr:glycosyltransferase [Micromonospora parastrephiae]
MPVEATDDARRAGPDAAGTPPIDLPMSYVLPLRWHSDSGLSELTDYLRWLAGHVEVLVVDGSPADLFARHADAWRGLVRHFPPDPAGRGLNGKVVGVLTGVEAARHEHVVIADDDVRYDEAGLRAVHRLLGRVDLVRPQNFFDPLPWHAWWDTGRTLLNRALGNDYPGTLAVRRSTFRAMGGYDPNVLFENLELIRAVRAYGGVEATPAWLYVRRLPPDAAHFRGQRVRQAYDDLAQPARLVTALRGPAGAGGGGPRPAACALVGATVAVARWPRRDADVRAATASSRRAPRWPPHSGWWNAASAAGWRSASGPVRRRALRQHPHPPSRPPHPDPPHPAARPIAPARSARTAGLKQQDSRRPSFRARPGRLQTSAAHGPDERYTGESWL